MRVGQFGEPILQGDEQGNVYGYGVGTAYHGLGHMFGVGDASVGQDGDLIAQAFLHQVAVKVE